MVREIKFRAWLEHENKMVEVVEIRFADFEGRKGPFVVLKNMLGYLSLEEFGIELLQYTGLKDRQGVEIYEGDIIEDKGMGKGQIVWDNAIVGYAAKLIPEPYDLFKWWCLDDCSKNDMKVIGNVYENPELLEAGE